MKRKITLLATLLGGLLAASTVDAGPALWFQQLMGMGAGVTAQGNGGQGVGGWGYGYGEGVGGWGYPGPKNTDASVTSSPAVGPNRRHILTKKSNKRKREM